MSNWKVSPGSKCSVCQIKTKECEDRLNNVHEYHLTMTLDGRRYMAVSNFRNCTVVAEFVRGV